jgi:hypothetical protein
MVHRAIIKIKDAEARAKYDMLVEALTTNTIVVSQLAYVLGAKAALDEHGIDVPLTMARKLGIIVRSFPGLLENNSPEEIAARAKHRLDELLLELVLFLLDASISGKMEYNSLDNRLAEIIFSEDDEEITPKQLEEMIEAVDGLKINKVGIA